MNVISTDMSNSIGVEIRDNDSNYMLHEDPGTVWDKNKDLYLFMNNFVVSKNRYM